MDCGPRQQGPFLLGAWSHRVTRMTHMTHFAIDSRLRAHALPSLGKCVMVRHASWQSGAIAVLDESGDLVEALDMPSIREANGRTATNAPLLAGILARSHARVAFREFVGARPTDAKVAAFAMGRAGRAGIRL
jgi:hypothetical protein